MIEMYLEAVLVTLKITVISTLLAYIIGIPLGVLLYGTDKSGIFPMAPVNRIVGFIVNIIRSIPFIILLVMTQPVAKLIVGSKIGDNAFIVYLVIAAAPFVARMIESSFREVDRGIIEAAQSMGSNNMQIILKVLLPEAKPSLIIGGAIAITTILGYTPMTYLIAGGGLGQLAIQYGLYRFESTTMYISSLLLIILVQIMQETLNYIAKVCDKRIRNK
ncbi:MAG TPA: ABC transporter permease [Firmicutes bacterium]|nr:ABC transporter permease [Bacillota bacterium]